MIRPAHHQALMALGLLCSVFLLSGCDEQQRNQAKIERIERQWQDELAELARARSECEALAKDHSESPDGKAELAICRETVRIRALTTHNIREAMDQRIGELRAAQR